jgi:ABC-2 type transport system ATP-binding protein
MVEAKNICKRYGKKLILNNISFSLDCGKAIGILGPNGAGKTTLLKIICGLTKSTSGQIELKEISRSQIVTILEDQHFFGHLSGIKNLEIYLDTSCNKKFDLARQFNLYGLEESKKVKYKHYSSGMKKRLDLMSVFIDDKQLYLLDEPTNALDIDSIISLNDQIVSLKNKGKSFIICSHHAQELEKICDYFLLMHEGAVLETLAKQEVLQKFGSLENTYRSLIFKK